MRDAFLADRSPSRATSWVSLVLILVFLAPCMHCFAHSAPAPQAPACHDTHPDTGNDDVPDGDTQQCDCQHSALGSTSKPDLDTLPPRSIEASAPQLREHSSLAFSQTCHSTPRPPDAAQSGVRLHLMHCVFLD